MRGCRQARSIEELPGTIADCVEVRRDVGCRTYVAKLDGLPAMIVDCGPPREALGTNVYYVTAYLFDDLASRDAFLRERIYPNETAGVIELHDSRLTAIRQDGDDLQLDLDAYVHMSEGRPGIDPGTGWTVLVRLTVRSATMTRDFEGDRLWITEGTITIGPTVLDGECPVDLEVDDAVEVRATGHEGSLTVTGTGLKVEAMGEAKFVEVFPGAR